MQKKYLILGLFLIFAAQEVMAGGILTNCGNISSGGTWILANNVASSGTCFTILADNIILDGAGYTINYSYSTRGYAVNNTAGYDNITIKDLNIVQGNSSVIYGDAIYGSGMVNSTITNNTIITSGSSGYGIFLYSSSNSNTLSNNIITTSGSDGSGIRLDSSSTNTLSNNSITTSGGAGFGIYLYAISNNTLSNNTITTSGSYGYSVALYSSSTNTLSNNIIKTSGNYGVGIRLSSSSTNTLSNNIITTSGISGEGILLYLSSDSNTILNNTITTSSTDGYGIYLLSSSNSNTLLNNTIRTSGDYSYGIHIDSSSNTNITRNKLNTTNAYAIYINPEIYINPTTIASYYNHTIDTTNTEQGKPIYYYFANTSITIENMYDIGQLYVTNSSNITIRNITIINKDGITLAMVKNSSVSDSNITTSGSSGHGIYLSTSSTNTISNNAITTLGISGMGIWLDSSGNSNILSNNIITTSGNYGAGIEISSSSTNTLLNNTITTSGNTGFGIALLFARNNIILGGSIDSTNSYDYSIWDAGTTNNFTNTNFTTREIYFYDNISQFNYRNDTTNYPNLWLKTKVSVSTVLNRTLASWTNSNLVWNETPDGTVTVNYQILGLLGNNYYDVYNTAAGLQSKSFTTLTDSNGALNFSLTISGNNEIRVVVVNITTCSVKGDQSPCDGKVDDFEILDYIDHWSMGHVSDFDLLTAIDNWAKP